MVYFLIKNRPHSRKKQAMHYGFELKFRQINVEMNVFYVTNAINKFVIAKILYCKNELYPTFY